MDRGPSRTVDVDVDRGLSRTVDVNRGLPMTVDVDPGRPWTVQERGCRPQTIDVDRGPSSTVDVAAAESRRRRWREMPLHMRSSIDGSGQSSSVASVTCRGPRAP